MRYRAIAFDLGGVLLDSEGAHEGAARRAAAHFGLTVPLEVWPRIHGGAYEDFFDQVLSPSESFGDVVKSMQVALCAYDAYHQEIQHSARLFPGAIELLDLSREKFDSLALATSSEWRLVDSALCHFGLAKYFDGVISGDHVTQKKPASETFLVAAWLLGVRPNSMVVVEDSVHGVRAARLARAHVIGIAGREESQRLRSAGAHHVVRDHAGLLAYIKAMN